VQLASYHPQRFLISFGAKTRLIVDRRRTLEHFHLLAHEYFHYWHNFSTLCGVKLFGFAQDLLSDFSHTLNPNLDGTSLGSSVLPPERANRCSEVIALRAGIEGWPGPLISADATPVDFEVLEIELDHDRTSGLANLAVPDPIAEIVVRTTFADQTSIEGRFLLGAHAIEEGIALLVEREMAKLNENAESPSVPCYPYLVLERVVQAVLGPTTPFTIAALGTLALLTTHAGPMLVVFCNQVRDALETGLSEQEALDGIIEEWREGREADIGRTRAIGAQYLAAHKGRGLSEGAVEYFCGQMNAALDERLLDPIFEIRGVFQTPHPRSWLISLMTKFPACNILQEEEGPPDQVGRDHIVGEPVPVSIGGFDSAECSRTIQAQQDFVLAHLNSAQNGWLPSTDVKSRCPYFTSCEMRLRVEQPDVCATQPWRSVSVRDGLCWYAAAIFGTMHPIEFKRRAEPSTVSDDPK
jgi:hypothetical protein